MGFLGTSPFEESVAEGGEKTSLKLERWGGLCSGGDRGGGIGVRGVGGK